VAHPFAAELMALEKLGLALNFLGFQRVCHRGRADKPLNPPINNDSQVRVHWDVTRQNPYFVGDFGHKNSSNATDGGRGNARTVLNYVESWLKAPLKSVSEEILTNP